MLLPLVILDSVATPPDRKVDISDNKIIQNVSTYLVKLVREAWFLMEAKKEVLSYKTPEKPVQVAGIEREMLDAGTSWFCGSHSCESQYESAQPWQDTTQTTSSCLVAGHCQQQVLVSAAIGEWLLWAAGV